MQLHALHTPTLTTLFSKPERRITNVLFMCIGFVVTTLIVAAMLIPTAPPAAALYIAPGQLVKSETNPAVYLIFDNKRYSFPNERTFFSWHQDFSEVSVISEAALSAFPLTKNVTYRPGLKPVKINTDPKVYAIASGGVLRWITNEQIAASIYGENWNTAVDDIPDAFFTNYTIGNPITEASMFDRTLELNINQSFNPSTQTVTESTPIGCQYENPICKEYEICSQNTCVRNLTASGVVAEYLTCLSTTEQQEIGAGFDINFVESADQAWEHPDYICDFSSDGSTGLPLYNQLRFLKNISFNRPLPFTNGKTIYEFMRLQTVSPEKYASSTGRLQISAYPSCDIGSSGYQLSLPTSTVFMVNLGGYVSRIYPVVSGSPTCEKYVPTPDFPSVLNGRYSNPIYLATLLVHESYHAITAKYHNAPDGSDKTIEQMGAWAAQFYFDAWIALYSTNVDANTKQLAKEYAADILKERFTENLCPADTALKSIVNLITPETCQ
ncbi:hypothetical protein KKG19_06005 [Patescibacteria group bacterium]|nr:hypothetical protein [Patescibacteria group bacterium]